ncbi:MAG: lipopolysaccharide biosynthesis protein [Prevotella sp.]|nr:lipopolysaccharide biosynthesis protein [Prevotella sp.]
MESLREKTARGLFWGGMNNVVLQLIGLVFGIVLGRLLSPDDFGLVAMITIFTLVATALQNSGFIVAIANLKEPTARDYNSVFWFNILVGGGLYVLLFLSSPLIARFYDTPALTGLSRYAFLSILFASLTTSQSAYLFKNMMVKQRAKSNIAAVLVSNIVGVAMAWRGMGYWAVATQPIIYNMVNAALFWHYSPWRPTWDIDFGPVRRMFRFSCKMLATMILTHVNNNILNILLGRYYTAHDTGNYNQAHQWNTKCTSVIQGMVDAVAQPVMVDLRGDSSRQLEALRKLVRFTSFLSFPLLLGFGLVAKEFIVLAVTEKWLFSAQLIQILCLAGAVLPLCSLLSNLIVSHGRSGLYLRCTLALSLLQMLTMVLIWPYGIRTMVCVYTFINIMWLFVWHFFVRRLIGYRLRHFLLDVLPFALSALAVMTAVHFLTRSVTSLWLLLGVRIALATALYYVVMQLAGAQILHESMAFLKGKFLSRGKA